MTSGDSDPTLESRATLKERVMEGGRRGASENEEQADAQQHQKERDEPEFFVVLEEVDELPHQTGLTRLAGLFEGIAFVVAHDVCLEA